MEVTLIGGPLCGLGPYVCEGRYLLIPRRVGSMFDAEVWECRYDGRTGMFLGERRLW
jgi:hypothetical protein